MIQSYTYKTLFLMIKPKFSMSLFLLRGLNIKNNNNFVLPK